MSGNTVSSGFGKRLADKLLIEEGDLVSVDNANGKLNIQLVNPRCIQ